MKILIIISAVLITHSNMALAENTVINKLLGDYQSQGASTGQALAGEQLWNQTFAGKPPFTKRSCASCHTRKLSNEGKHARTGKALKPMAPSVNPQSLTDVKKITKWFKRNCKWTLGRECTVQEKSDILSFINQQ
ncbi:MAG: DUF1924 domain-containing protein [Gammaproteobacteria bacterium]|nr:DUF1924 domain-containing protein [Gammaproteobacteria bacterium]MCW8910866.1 DUF1924 domain-containing protein [Gammaproteobacteria bacterium]MCW9004800.1 DUF1924 domain-containing protein [Gammaproteobacteria bacterium]MCW9054993.1 DUF1924 domain-containing protein [Gammaproteobacteria bacterium]